MCLAWNEWNQHHFVAPESPLHSLESSFVNSVYFWCLGIGNPSLGQFLYMVDVLDLHESGGFAASFLNRPLFVYRYHSLNDLMF